jgi:hypothetical protein
MYNKDKQKKIYLDNKVIIVGRQAGEQSRVAHAHHESPSALAPEPTVRGQAARATASSISILQTSNPPSNPPHKLPFSTSILFQTL